MRQLSPRGWEIFQLIMNDPFGVITVRQIAADLGVSERTVRYDLAGLSAYLEEHAIALRKIPHKGLCIAEEDVAKALDLMSAEDACLPIAYLSTEERVYAIIAALLDQTCPHSIAEMANRLGVSRSTAKRDFDRASMWLSEHQMAVEYESQMGWQLNVDEYRRRTVMVDFLEEAAEQGTAVLMSFTDNAPIPFRSLLRTDDLERVALKLSRLCARRGEHLTDEGFQRIVHYICVAVSRMRSGRFVSADASQGLSGASLDDIVELLKELCPSNEPFHTKEEAAVIDAILMASPRLSGTEERGSFMDMSERITRRFLKEASRSLGLDLFADDSLMRAMTVHVKAMIARSKMGIRAKNPMLRDIQAQFPDLFSACGEALVEVLAEYGITPSDDEVSYFVTYVGATMERLRDKPLVNRCTRVAVVCGAGIGTASFLSQSLANEYPHMEIVSLLAARDCANTDFSDIDLVLTTVDIPYTLPRPTLRVSPMLTRTDIRKIDAFLGPSMANSVSFDSDKLIDIVERSCDIRDREQLMCDLEAYKAPAVPDLRTSNHGFMTLEELIDRGEIQIGVHVETWEEAVIKAARPLLDDGRMTAAYLDQVFEMARGYQQFGVILAPLCAPHAEPDDNNKACISVLTLSDDIDVVMGNTKVPLNVVMLLCLKTPVAHAMALDELFTLVDEYPSFIEDVRSSRTSSALLSTVSRYLSRIV